MFDAYYSGSSLLKPLSDSTGIEIDRLNFIVSQLTAIFISIFMRKCLHPKDVSQNTRHMFSLLVGMSMIYFCFGQEIFHLLILSTVCYVVMLFQSPKTMQLTVFVISIGYLAWIHLKRLIYNYGAYNLDVTGPLMVMVERISGLAFSLHDGLACEEENISAYRKKYVTKKVPTVIEYYGYLFQFQSILAGPNIMFKDYVQFIDGTNFTGVKNKKGEHLTEPPVAGVALKKFGISMLCIAIHFTLYPRFSIEKAKENDFIFGMHPVKQILYLVAATSLTRFMYYHAWILADAICNASGLGFNGYDDEGNARWDLTTNVYIKSFELSQNTRSLVNAWNIGTNTWLRFVVYERVKRHQTFFTFLLSAVWHGFYPGYYVCFITAALFVSAARVVRKIVRPYFLGSTKAKMVYDVLTFATTKLTTAYFTFPFVMYSFWPAVYIYRQMFFIFHVSSFLVLFALPVVRKFLPKPPHPTVKED